MDDDYDQVKPKVPAQIGVVIDRAVKESDAIRTVMRQHTEGFSVTQYRRSFMHNGQVEIPGTSRWNVIRHREWTTESTYDWLHESMADSDPIGVPGDRND